MHLLSMADAICTQADSEYPYPPMGLVMLRSQRLAEPIKVLAIGYALLANAMLAFVVHSQIGGDGRKPPPPTAFR